MTMRWYHVSNSRTSSGFQISQWIFTQLVRAARNCSSRYVPVNVRTGHLRRGLCWSLRAEQRPSDPDTHAYIAYIYMAYSLNIHTIQQTHRCLVSRLRWASGSSWYCTERYWVCWRNARSDDIRGPNKHQQTLRNYNSHNKPRPLLWLSPLALVPGCLDSPRCQQLCCPFPEQRIAWGVPVLQCCRSSIHVAVPSGWATSKWTWWHLSTKRPLFTAERHWPRAPFGNPHVQILLIVIDPDRIFECRSISDVRQCDYILYNNMSFLSLLDTQGSWIIVDHHGSLELLIGYSLDSVVCVGWAAAAIGEPLLHTRWGTLSAWGAGRSGENGVIDLLHQIGLQKSKEFQATYSAFQNHMIISYHFISYHFISYHIISYHIIFEFCYVPQLHLWLLR